MSLFPPIVASSMPAFDVNSDLRVYFSISEYNQRNKIQHVQVQIRRQSSNASVVNNLVDVLIKDYSYDYIVNQFFVTISSGDIADGFEPDVLYKVQLRFSEIPYSKEEDLTVFLNTHLSSFSEWSTVCIVKPIISPRFQLLDFQLEDNEKAVVEEIADTDFETNVNYFSYNLPQFVGQYDRNGGTQVLKKWRIRLLNSSYNKDNEDFISDYTLADSDWQIVSAYNYNTIDNLIKINCKLSYELVSNTVYKILFEIETKNGYTDSKSYTFKYYPQSIDKLPGQLSIAVNEEEGYIKLSYSSDQPVTGNLCLRRSDSRSNFLVWQDLKNFTVIDIQSFDYYDFTAESGIAYQYFVQRISARGRRGTPLYDQSQMNGKATIGEWEHAFLLETNTDGKISTTKQLKMKFDFQISSWKTNISQSRIDTIGGTYPYVRRNGNMYYRSFPCTGTITACMDNADLFVSEETLNDGYNKIYHEFNYSNDDITDPLYDKSFYNKQYDYTYERKFREQVEKFLYNSKPKLYKSMQEGNLLVKIMQVSLTPRTELGRLVYTFSATAYEIDSANVKNYDKYKIIDVGQYSSRIKETRRKLGQVNSYSILKDDFSNYFPAGQDLMATVSPLAASLSIAKTNHLGETYNGNIYETIGIDYLRITVESEPYLIVQYGGSYYPLEIINENGSSSKNPMIPSEANIDDLLSGSKNYNLYQLRESIKSNSSIDGIYLGSLFTIGDSEKSEQIIISYPNTIYQIQNDNLRIKSIIPARATGMTVDYQLIYTVQEDTSKVPRSIKSQPVVGQIIGKYNKNVNIIDWITYKYYYLIENQQCQYINGVQSVTVDTEPGTVVEVLTTVDTDNESELQRSKFIVNETGQLHLEPYQGKTTTYLKSLYIKGFNLSQSNLNMDRSPEQEENINLQNYLSSIQNPVNFDYVNINNMMYIYYQNEWRQVEKQTEITGEISLTVLYPVDVMIFYTANLRKDVY